MEDGEGVVNLQGVREPGTDRARLKSLLGTAWLRHDPHVTGSSFAWTVYSLSVRHCLYVHLVWTTRGRERLIGLDLARFLCSFLRAMARKERAYVLEIGMVQTHIHVLARVHPAVPISILVKRLKGGSSAIAAKERIGSTHLYWAKGYSVDSIGRRSLQSVRTYLRHQPLKHPDEAILDWTGDTPEYDEQG